MFSSRCRFKPTAFEAVIRHSASSRSISGHCALRRSPGRTNTSGASRKAHFVTKNPA